MEERSGEGQRNKWLSRDDPVLLSKLLVTFLSLAA